jgi:hypothetical protein
MQKVDHFSIYLLIAGSYTPFCLVTLRGPWGWTLFGIVWGLALIGILQEIKPRSEARILSIVIYAVMGWIVLVAVKPLLAALGTAGLPGWRRAGCCTPWASSFCPGSSPAPCPRDLASVRDRREPAALCGDFLLCPVIVLQVGARPAMRSSCAWACRLNTCNRSLKVWGGGSWRGSPRTG